MGARESAREFKVRQRLRSEVRSLGSGADDTSPPYWREDWCTHACRHELHLLALCPSLLLAVSSAPCMVAGFRSRVLLFIVLASFSSRPRPSESATKTEAVL